MIWDEILAERACQDREHGGPDNDDLLTCSDWIGLLTQFAGRAFSCARMGRPDLYRSRILQTVAIGVAALEAFDRQHGPLPLPPEALRAGPDVAPAPGAVEQVAEGDPAPVPATAPVCLSGG
jgi:hypothetical protein